MELSVARLGSTRFTHIFPAHRRSEIGGSWYAREAQGTAVNPEAKLLLLGQAFAARARRVELVCDARNARSRAAILKLGARDEGRLRAHMALPDAGRRDSLMFSILDED